MGGLMSKGSGNKITKAEARSIKAELMEEEAEDSDDEEYQMEKNALRAMEAGGRTSVAAAYEAMAAKEVVYDTFSDELRAGYAARIQARQAWLEDIEQHVRNREEKERRILFDRQSATAAKSLRFGTAISHKRIPGWPAGGMHEHGW
ncbi:unnamed protein product [Cladocopium goreaui]|uniref:Uncharacterized protein n=1 Tax=Cladocopium goreaui TaxID=2562237 RepID=A0A9P1FJ10_9DINO|nr:unnamed protein product [Cladocopium goreaui]